MSVFINGKKISSAWVGGRKIIGSGLPPCYGVLFWKTLDTNEIVQNVIETENDWDLLFGTDIDEDLQFSFTSETINARQVVGFQFNTNDASRAYTPVSIPEDFLCKFVNLNMPITFPSWVNTVSDYFLSCNSNDFAFNSDIDFGGVETIGSTLSYYNSKFLTGNIRGNNLKTINSSFLTYSNWNGTLDLPALEIVNGDFLCVNASFNQEINLPSLKTVNGDFLCVNASFNQEINLPSLKTVNGDFLWNCDSFNSDLNVPNLQTVVGDFLYYCDSFNSDLNVPNLQTVGDFLYECINFNKPLNLPSLVTANNVLYNCYRMNRPITIGTNLNSIDSLLLIVTSDDSPFASSITIESNSYQIGSLMCIGYNCCFQGLSGSFELKANADYQGEIFSGILALGPAPTFICNCPPSQIAYNQMSFTRYKTGVENPNYDIIFTGPYANEMAAKFPAVTGSGWGRNPIVQ